MCLSGSMGFRHKVFPWRGRPSIAMATKDVCRCENEESIQLLHLRFFNCAVGWWHLGALPNTPFACVLAMYTEAGAVFNAVSGRSGLEFGTASKPWGCGTPGVRSWWGSTGNASKPACSKQCWAAVSIWDWRLLIWRNPQSHHLLTDERCDPLCCWQMTDCRGMIRPCNQRECFDEMCSPSPPRRKGSEYSSPSCSAQGIGGFATFSLSPIFPHYLWKKSWERKLGSVWLQC